MRQDNGDELFSGSVSTSTEKSEKEQPCQWSLPIICPGFNTLGGS